MPATALHAPALAAADQCTTMFFVFGKEDIYTACDMPADALQANDISRSDFMRRKVLFWWARYINTTQMPAAALHATDFRRCGVVRRHVVFCLACTLFP